MFSGRTTRKEHKIAANRVGVGVCLIAKRLRGIRTAVFSGAVVKTESLFPNWRRQFCIITSGKIDSSKKHLLCFKNLDSNILGLKKVKLEHVTSSEDAVEYILGLAIIPLDDSKLTKFSIIKSSILTYRPFPVSKEEVLDGSVCYIVDGHPDLFTIKAYDLEYISGEYVLKLPERGEQDAVFKTLSELTAQGSNNLHPDGAVILKSVDNTLVAVGALAFEDDKISPVSFSQLQEFGRGTRPDLKSPTVARNEATASKSEGREQPADTLVKLAQFQGERRPLLQQQNNGFGPLIEPRGRMGDIAHVIVIIILGAIIICLGDKESIIFEAIALSLSFTFGELLHRTCLFTEEFRHRETRYGGNWKEVFRSTFGSKFTLLVGLAATIFLPLIVYRVWETPFRQRHLLVALLYFLFRLQALSPVEESELKERDFNAADALACSYYWYLKIVLPKLESAISSSDQFRHKVTRKRLFILLPRHGYAYGDINCADSRVKFAGNIFSLEMDRFGIKRYPFKHSVYRLEMPRPDGGIDKYHILMEYATPLANLYDMSDHSSVPLTRQERDYQARLFVCKLKEILDSCSECRGKYQLVPFGEDNLIADTVLDILRAAELPLFTD